MSRGILPTLRNYCNPLFCLGSSNCPYITLIYGVNKNENKQTIFVKGTTGSTKETNNYNKS
jgi:hypothetical protein